MKYSSILLLTGLVAFSSCKENQEKPKWLPDVKNQDHGPVQQKEFDGDFDEIEVSQSIDAEIIKSEAEKVVISAPSNIIDEVLVDRDGQKIHIHLKSGIRVTNAHNIKAKIYAKDFSKLKANSAASIVLKDKFTQEKTSIVASSSGSIEGTIEANNLSIFADSSGSFEGTIWAVDFEAETSSAGSISVLGKSKKADLSSSSGSSISAKDVVIENLKADASSGADVEAGVANSLDARASSGGSVNVYKKGNLRSVNKDESSGGSVSIN